ncbi:MAG TPA: Calx-beta domain-containing protein [Thermoanaerobaculia bacterium]
MRTPARIALGLFVSVLSLIAPAAFGDDGVTATKSVGGSFIQGTNVTYTIVMTNGMAVTQNDNPGDEFRDPMPSGLLFVSAGVSSGTAVYLTTIDTVAWNGSIPAGGSVTLTIVATIDPAVTGAISNQGQTFYDADSNGSNESSAVTDDPSTGTEADATSFSILQSGIVSATKSVSGTFVQGTDVTYTIVMTNDMTITQGDNDGHEFTDTLPDNLTLVSASATSGAIANSGNTVLWDGTLAAGESVTITIVATISPIVTGEMANQGHTVFDRDGDNQNESNQPTDDPSTEAAYDPTIFHAVLGSVFDLSASSYAVSESAASLDVTVNRTGGSSGVAAVSYTIAAGTAQGEDFVGGTFELSFADGETSKTFNVTIVDDALDELDQTIALSLSDPSNGSILGAQSTATIAIQDDDAPPTLSIDDVTLTEGDSGSQVATFTITKTGETELDVTVTADPTLVSGTATCCGPSNDWGGPITGMTFLPGTTTRTAQVTVFGDLEYENDETVIMTLTDAVNATLADDTGVLTILNNDPAPADLSLTKTGTPDPISAGSLLTYTITVTNNGPGDAADVTLTDTVPSGTVYITSSAPAGWSCATPGIGATGTLTCTSASFASGASAVITMSVTVNASLATGTIISNTATVASSTADPNPGNDSQTTTTTVQPVTSFTATKSVSGTFLAGSSVTYTVVLTNNMGHTQQNNFGNELADILPSGLALTGASATSGTVLTIPAANIVTWNGTIPDGGTVTITITATITATSGTISSQGNALIDTDDTGDNETSLDTDDPSTAADDDATSFNVVQPGIVTSTMSVNGTFVQGTNVTYTVVMTNDMTVTQPDNFGHEWTDILPSGLTLVSVSATSGTTGSVANIAYWDGSIASGGSVTLTIVAAISSTASGTISNQGQTIFDRNGDGQNESSQVTDDPSTAASYDATSFTVIANQADLSLTMTYTPAVPGPSDNITYTLVVSNAGPLTATNVVVSDNRPDSATFQSVSTTQGGCTTADPVVCSVGALANGASATITLVVKAPSSYNPLTNSATATSDLPDPTPASASTSITCTKTNGKPCKQ